MRTIMMKGVDMSRWNGNVDFQKVRAAGYDFCILRAGYGLTEDIMFQQNYRKAVEAGLLVGAYWYAYWRVAPEKEADMFLSVVGDKKLDMGAWYDVEYEPNIIAETVTPAARVTGIIRALEKLKTKLPLVGLYCSASFPASYLGNDKRLDDWPLWVAHYGVSAPGYVNRWAIWQKSCTGRVPGVSTDCDIDECRDGFPEAKKEETTISIGEIREAVELLEKDLMVLKALLP